MIRHTVKGLRRKLIPVLYLFFLTMLAISTAEAIYKTEYGTSLNYFYIVLTLSIVLVFLYIVSYVSFEYSLVGDIFVSRVFHFGKQRKSYVVHLYDSDVRFYMGIRRHFKGLMNRRVFCYLPFFGGIFKVCAICYTDEKGRKVKMLFKPTVAMAQSLMDCITEKPSEPPTDIFM